MLSMLMVFTRKIGGVRVNLTGDPLFGQSMLIFFKGWNF